VIYLDCVSFRVSTARGTQFPVSRSSLTLTRRLSLSHRLGSPSASANTEDNGFITIDRGVLPGGRPSVTLGVAKDFRHSYRFS